MTVVIDETICLVFFVHNLANWHVSCKANFANKWSSFPVPLERQEVEALEILKNVFNEYLHKNHELWAKELILSHNKGKIPDEIVSYFKVFYPRFKYFYDSQRNNMKMVKSYLENISDKFEYELGQTKKFYGFDGDVPVGCYLTMSSDANKQAGGMLLESKEDQRYFVIMEFGDYVLSNDNWEIENIFLHELSHLYQSSKLFESLLNKYSERLEIPFYLSNMNLEKKDLLTEIVNAGIWGSNGLLSKKIYGEKINAGLSKQNDSYESFIDSCTSRLSEDARRYISEGRVIDDEFFNNIVEIFQ